MKDNYHVFSDGRLERAEDTVRLVAEDGEKTYLPIENAEAVFLHGQIDSNTRLMSLLNDEGVAMHVFGWNDYYSGSMMPERGQLSGRTVLAQTDAYRDESRRVAIARAFVEGSIHNMVQNVAYYDSRDYDLEDVRDEMTSLAAELEAADSVESIMGIEASARRQYYRLFATVLPDSFAFDRRQYDPPDNEVNSLISFGNSLVYANVVSAIRATALDPTISFLHEPGERRYSLALDIAELFKPVIADRVIFRLVNRSQLDAEDFERELDACLLTDDGRETFTKEFEKTLEKTVEHPSLGRKVSYQYLMRVEAYKLKKHLLTGEAYEPFKRWW